MTARRRRPSAFRSTASMLSFLRSAPCWGIAAVLIVPISQAHYLMGRDPLLCPHRRHHRRPRLAARHSRCRDHHRSRRWHSLRLLLADACKDHRHIAGCDGAGVPSAGAVEPLPDDACLLLHIAVIALLFVLNFTLPDYHHGVLARVMVLAVFAMGYNLFSATPACSASAMRCSFQPDCMAPTGDGASLGMVPAFLSGLAAGFAVWWSSASWRFARQASRS